MKNSFILSSIQVECTTLCKIQWMKNEELIDGDDERYRIEEKLIPEDLDANQFQSVVSKLSWNLENWIMVNSTSLFLVLWKKLTPKK